jgi:hypothetical protein
MRAKWKKIFTVFLVMRPETCGQTSYVWGEKEVIPRATLVF